LVTNYVTKGLESRLEEIICHMETATLDIDQITTLCKQHNLYDALIYVWNQAIGDYITPLIDLLTLLIPLVQNGDYFSNGNIMEDPIYSVNALKMFPYMSYTFSGRIYPIGEGMGEQEALNAKAELYWFLFSGKTISWPRGSGKPFLTKPNSGNEPSFPYLRMILKFDAPSFLSALNEAFEDSFLNGSPDRAANGGTDRDLPEEQVFGLSVNRQYIVSILLEVMNPSEFAIEDTACRGEAHAAPADHHAFFAAGIAAASEAIGEGGVERVEKVLGVWIARITPGLTPGVRLGDGAK
jgi:hypothetical protein